MKTNWDNFCGHRQVLAEFIRIYRSEPCLWMTKSPEYRDRQLKETAYERLAAKLREIDSTANREKVVKKINSLRTNYRKEKKKLEERPESSNYKPTLWYYNMFDFLEGHELPGSNAFDTNDSQDAFEDYDEYESDPLTEIYNELDEFEAEEEPEQQQQIKEQQPQQQQQQQQDRKSTIEQIRSSPLSHAGSSRKSIISIKKKPNLKRPRSNDSSDESDYTSVHLKETIRKENSKMEDRHDLFARMVALKLRSLSDARQRVLAEKAINDALFMAEIGELTLEHVNSPLNFNISQSNIEYINSSTSHLETTE